MTNPWYPVTDVHPGPIVQVRAIVSSANGNAELIVCRGKAHHGDKWAEWKAGRSKPLPPGAVVTLWQPQAPEKWKAPLPDPVAVVEPRMWSSTMAFTLVDEADSSELAREMERDREDAKRNGAPEEGSREPLQWWRDADAIRYEPAGQITPRMCEGRIMRAVAISGYGGELTLKYKSFSTVLAAICEKTPPPYAMSDYVPRMNPLPADWNDFERAMGWFAALNPKPLPEADARADWSFTRPQWCMIMRSYNIPLSFGEIGEMLPAKAKDKGGAVSGEAARRMYERAIRRACRIANGVDRTNHAQQIEAIRDRNRSWKLKRHDPVAQIEDALSAFEKVE